MAKKYFYHFIYYSHEVFVSLAMSRNFHFFAMRKAMSPLHKTKVMKKNTENRPRPKATIYIQYDAEKAEKFTGYTTRWKMQRKETLNISLFIRELNEQYKITKSAFHETSGIHNKVFNKYLNVPDNCSLSTEAIERIASSDSMIRHEVMAPRSSIEYHRMLRRDHPATLPGTNSRTPGLFQSKPLSNKQ